MSAPSPPCAPPSLAAAGISAGREDVVALVTLDAQFAESGETTLSAEQVQRLADLGWVEEGDKPDEISISMLGEDVLAEIDRQVATITPIITAGATGESQD